MEAFSGDSLHLLWICSWHFFLGFLHSLGQKFKLFCRLVLIFLSALFLQNITICVRTHGVTGC